MVEILKKIFEVLILLVLIGLGSLLCLVNFDLGDYCVSVYDMLLNPMLIFIYLFVLFVYFTAYANKFLKRYLFFAFPFFILVVSQIDFKGFFRTPKYIGAIESEYGHGSRLTLFDDHTFRILWQRHHHRCYLNGNYRLENGLLTLDRKDLPGITDSLFTFEYRLIEKDQCLTAKGFHFLDISL